MYYLANDVKSGLISARKDVGDGGPRNSNSVSEVGLAYIFRFQES